MNIVLEREPKTQAAGIDQTASGGAPAGPRARIGRSIKIVPQLDKYPKLVSFGQTALDRPHCSGLLLQGSWPIT